MIQQSTTYSYTFYLVLSADLSLATGQTVAASISKAGASFNTAAGAVTEVGGGWYRLSLTAADTATLGDLSIACTATGCDSHLSREQIVNFGPLSGGIDIAESELVAIPTATSSTRQKIAYLWQYFGLKRTITTSAETLFKNDNATTLGTAAISDDGTTATKAKVA